MWGINLFFLATNLAMAAGWHPPLNTIARLLDLDRPGSLGKWWLSAQLLFLSVAALLVMGTRRGTRGACRMDRLGFPVFALITMLMSAETIARMKQDVEGVVRHLLPGGHLWGHTLNWTEVFAPLIVTCAVFFVAFARRVLAGVPYARKLALWGVAAWTLSIVLEALECSVFYGRPVATHLRAFEPTVEQMLEVGGTTLLLMALVELGFVETARQAKAASAHGEARQTAV